MGAEPQLQRPDGEMAWGVVDPTGEQGLFAAARCHSTVDVFQTLPVQGLIKPRITTSV